MLPGTNFAPAGSMLIRVPPGIQPGQLIISGNGHPIRRKRAQVKNACINCQKACKKCDDGRPCQRCIKYGIEDTCRSSKRKERKKGIKRGPYKKRKHLESDMSVSSMGVIHSDIGPQHSYESHQSAHHHLVPTSVSVSSSAAVPFHYSDPRGGRSITPSQDYVLQQQQQEHRIPSSSAAVHPHHRVQHVIRRERAQTTSSAYYPSRHNMVMRPGEHDWNDVASEPSIPDAFPAQRIQASAAAAASSGISMSAAQRSGGQPLMGRGSLGIQTSSGSSPRGGISAPTNQQTRYHSLSRESFGPHSFHPHRRSTSMHSSMDRVSTIPKNQTILPPPPLPQQCMQKSQASSSQSTISTSKVITGVDPAVRVPSRPSETTIPFSLSRTNSSMPATVDGSRRSSGFTISLSKSHTEEESKEPTVSPHFHWLNSKKAHSVWNDSLPSAVAIGDRMPLEKSLKSQSLVLPPLSQLMGDKLAGFSKPDNATTVKSAIGVDNTGVATGLLSPTLVTATSS
ncbi:hypothetical protein H4219_005134 [Mycoemilia scoparia]|uniref:Zn(2)-C6 fungal-type domain-containing protein n=1 Tax=Mycoemilia scoparia TaxID=417184 RepID=A0A9W8DLN7_9FUNG|nr:hypothetical protein H4219_005134 [Mycoemilia scoparia]